MLDVFETFFVLQRDSVAAHRAHATLPDFWRKQRQHLFPQLCGHCAVPTSTQWSTSSGEPSSSGSTTRVRQTSTNRGVYAAWGRTSLKAQQASCADVLKLLWKVEWTFLTNAQPLSIIHSTINNNRSVCVKYITICIVFFAIFGKFRFSSFTR